MNMPLPWHWAGSSASPGNGVHAQFISPCSWKCLKGFSKGLCVPSSAEGLPENQIDALLLKTYCFSIVLDTCKHGFGKSSKTPTKQSSAMALFRNLQFMWCVLVV
jgi:hypothetical protein